jgi:hypothetical protein
MQAAICYQLILFPLQPPDYPIHLRSEVGNHNDQKDQQERIGVDNP